MMEPSTLVAAETPATQAIAARLKELGGSPLRARMIDGKMQYWTTMNGRVIAWANLWNCQRGLGINVSRKERHRMESNSISDPVDLKQAMKISGYSGGAILTGVRAGEIECDRSKKPFVLSKSSVLSWSEAHRKQGGQFLPRGKRKKATLPKVFGDKKGWSVQPLGNAGSSGMGYWLRNGDSPAIFMICEDADLPSRIARLLEFASGI